MQDSLLEIMRSTGHLSGSNAAYVEDLYESFLADAESVPGEWRDFFQSLAAANDEEVPMFPMPLSKMNSRR